MASVHNELQRGTLSAAVTRALGSMRGGGGLERFGETLQPVMDIWSLPEWAYLRTETLGAGTRVAAVGANNGAIALGNPLTSRSLVVIEAVRVLPVTAGFDTFDVYLATDSTVALTASQATQRRDERPADDAGGVTARNCRAVIRYSDGTIAAIPPDWGTAFERGVFSSTLEGRELLTPPVILPPGRMLVIYDVDTASSFSATFRFRERAYVQDELGG